MVLAILQITYGAMTFAALSGNFKLVSRLYAFAKYVVDILCFTGPVFLLSTRWVYASALFQFLLTWISRR